MAIHIKKNHKGLLHRDTHTPAGEPIPESKIRAAKNSKDPAVRKRATFAENAKHFNHHRGAARVLPRHHPESAYRR